MHVQTLQDMPLLQKPGLQENNKKKSLHWWNTNIKCKAVAENSGRRSTIPVYQLQMDHLYADGCIGQQMWERNAQKSSSAAAPEPSTRIHLRNLSNIGYISCKPGICDTIKVVVFFYGIAHGVLSQHLFNFVAVIQSLLRSKRSNMAMVHVTLASFTFLPSLHHWLQSSNLKVLCIHVSSIA